MDLAALVVHVDLVVPVVLEVLYFLVDPAVPEVHEVLMLPVFPGDLAALLVLEALLDPVGLVFLVDQGVLFVLWVQLVRLHLEHQ